MKIFSYIFPVVLVVLIALTLVSCDDTTSADEAEMADVPEKPSFSDMNMKTDMFDGSTSSMNENAVMEELWYQVPYKLVADTFEKAIEGEKVMQYDQFPSFLVASTLVKALEGIHQANVSLANNFFANWIKDEAALSNGEYVWDYEIQDPETGETFSIHVTAAVMGDNVNWNVIAELDIEEGGFAEQQIMEGTSDLDGSTGQWTVTIEIPEKEYSFESTSSWVFDGEDLAEMDLNLSMNEAERYINAEANYELEDNAGRIYDSWIDTPDLEEASQNLPWDIDLTESFHVEWNVETETGSITIGDSNFCWDENKMPADC